MDYGTVGSIFTVVVFVSFVGIVIWAFSAKRKSGFDEAANLVFDDESTKGTVKTTKQQESSGNE
ncbi:MAG: cbb3-type cytochrome oxidase subunit 3 [Aestuariibacter sp.]